MEIKKDDLRKILGAEEVQAYENAIITLFVVSQKYPRLKKLNLEGLSPEQRSAKLHHWGENHRFVAVVDIGDQIFAHVHANFVQQLEQQSDLAIDGKKVTVKALTNNDSALLEVVGAAFENQLANEEEENEEKNINAATSSSAPRQYYARRLLVSDQLYTDHWIARIQNIPAKVITNVLKQLHEVQDHDAKIQKERKERERILKDEIDRGILAGDIKKGEITQQTLKGEELVASTKHVNFARGGELL